jgi:hypothetical protein
MRLVQIDDYVRNEVIKVKQYALEHPFGVKQAEAVLAGTSLPVGDNPDHVVHIHDGIRAVYSVDIHNDKKYHHLSLSSETGYPGIPEAEMVLEVFGMGTSVQNLESVWIEENMRAINFLKEFE